MRDRIKGQDNVFHMKIKKIKTYTFIKIIIRVLQASKMKFRKSPKTLQNHILRPKNFIFDSLIIIEISIEIKKLNLKLKH